MRSARLEVGRIPGPWRLAVALALLICAQVARAETPASDPQADASPLDGYTGPAEPPPDPEGFPAGVGEGRGEASRAALFPRVWCAHVEDPTTREACWDAYRAGLAYHARGLEHRSSVFRWQYLTARVIFVVVLLLVGTGVYFSWVQFRRGEASETHEIEIGTAGVKVASPVLGVIILTLSLGFFYLYLVHVYPIEELL